MHLMTFNARSVTLQTDTIITNMCIDSLPGQTRERQDGYKGLMVFTAPCLCTGPCKNCKAGLPASCTSGHRKFKISLTIKTDL